MFGFNMFPDNPRPFNTQYKCFSVSMLPGNERQDVERGGKIIMPPSALDTLTRLNIVYPMLFKLTNKKTNRITHCGVLEFVADEGKVYLPYWMMHNLLLDEGEILNIESVSLPVATYARFQPQSEDFLDITNPKAVLENGLRSFACLTTGDIVAIKYNARIYEMCVLESKPGPAVSIIECDMNVEFAPPVGYKEPIRPVRKEDQDINPDELMPEPAGFVAFKGQGNRLNGKKKKKEDSAAAEPPASKPVYVRGIPDYDYKIGTLRFLRNVKPVNNKEPREANEFKPFAGEGNLLRRSKKR
ncbi:ubiquitin recognition factor in ER-associated degradation protein 1 isoform X2 [Belonocnema kinseyi]|uniref:ubiquitin recognition factor in ER-associated degradation protein 1 isoform X2 n=1 Tax=Belonocnema kinseyi TaxID=2817044 RepID=UPI00143D5446|nr:ubiquitin recognition factor in ER-associated degradation protein 1 isoform X2 [Belonocnema kinseyi]